MFHCAHLGANFENHIRDGGGADAWAISLLGLQCVVWHPAAVSPTLHDKATRWSGGYTEAFRCNGARDPSRIQRSATRWSDPGFIGAWQAKPWNAFLLSLLWLQCAIPVMTLQVCSMKLMTKRTMVSDLYGYWSTACIQLTLNSVWETLDYMDELLQQFQPAEEGSSMDYSPFLSKEHMLLYLLVHGTKPMVIPNNYSASFNSYLHVFETLTQSLYIRCRVRVLWSLCGIPWRLWSLQFPLCRQLSVSSYLLICRHRRYLIWCFVTYSKQYLWSLYWFVHVRVYICDLKCRNLRCISMHI